MSPPTPQPTNAPEDPADGFLTLREQVVRRLEILAKALETRAESLELRLQPRLSAGSDSSTGR